MKLTGMFAALAAAVAMAAPALAANPTVTLTIANRGDITLELYQKDAPATVAHFLALCKKGFYNGIIVHRVEPDFVVQAGDPQTKTLPLSDPRIGSGGSGKNIPFESNSRTNDKGTLAMALSAPRSATGDSQWFINLKDNSFLNGNYCVFGKVVKGMDVVMKVRKGDKIKSAK